MFGSRRSWSKVGLLTAALLGFICGLSSFVIALVLFSNEDPLKGERLLTFAATVTPASLAAGATIFGVQTWADSRRAAREAKARETLEELTVYAANAVSGLNLDQERPLRARVATWASPQLLMLMAHRSSLIDQIAGEFEAQIAEARAGLPEGAKVTVNLGARLSDIGRSTADLISRARDDLGLDPASPAMIYEGIWSKIAGYSYAESRDRDSNESS